MIEVATDQTRLVCDLPDRIIYLGPCVVRHYPDLIQFCTQIERITQDYGFSNRLVRAMAGQVLACLRPVAGAEIQVGEIMRGRAWIPLFSGSPCPVRQILINDSRPRKRPLREEDNLEPEEIPLPPPNPSGNLLMDLMATLVTYTGGLYSGYDFQGPSHILSTHTYGEILDLIYALSERRRDPEKRRAAQIKKSLDESLKDPSITADITKFFGLNEGN